MILQNSFFRVVLSCYSKNRFIAKSGGSVLQIYSNSYMAFINSYTIAALEKLKIITCPAKTCNEIVTYKLPFGLPPYQRLYGSAPYHPPPIPTRKGLN